MNTKHLKEFLELAQLCSIPLVSQKLSISADELMTDIDTLEKDIGLPLFCQNGRKIELSTYGKSFIPFAKDSIDKLEAGLEVISAIAYQTNETINVGISPLINPKYLSGLLFGFMSLYPHIHINITQNAALPLVQGLKKQEFDWLLCCDAVTLFNDEELHYVPLIEMPFVVLISKDNPLSKYENLTIDDLKNVRHIFTNKTTRDNHLRFFATITDELPQTMVYSGDTTSIYDLIANDVGIFHTTGYDHAIDKDRIAVIPISKNGIASETLMLVWTNQLKMTPGHILLKNYLLTKKEL